MQEQIRETCKSESLRKQFIALKANGNLVDPLSSATKLLILLKTDTFESGSHIDYFDK